MGIWYPYNSYVLVKYEDRLPLKIVGIKFWELEGSY